MASLTQHDLSILSKIHDPEAAPSAPLLIDASMPKDPHHTPDTYVTISGRERIIISNIQSIELQIAGLKPTIPDCPPLLEQYHRAIAELDKLIEEYPKYASVRNNRAQALRRIYGDGILVSLPDSSPIDPGEARPLQVDASEETLSNASKTILTDLSIGISLLTPPPFSPISQTSAKTLASLYTQRGAIYHLTSKHLSQSGTKLLLSFGAREEGWTSTDFGEAASRDFTMGGRYGNEVAKALAVAANPTAKLCGEMVREGLRKEYGSYGQTE